MSRCSLASRAKRRGEGLAREIRVAQHPARDLRLVAQEERDQLERRRWRQAVRRGETA